MCLISNKDRNTLYRCAWLPVTPLAEKKNRLGLVRNTHNMDVGSPAPKILLY